MIPMLFLSPEFIYRKFDESSPDPKKDKRYIEIDFQNQKYSIVLKRRYITLFRNNPVCVNCGVRGNIFLFNRDLTQKN